MNLKADARSPVTSILAAATILKHDLMESGPLSEETEFLLNTILDSAKLLIKLFEELELELD